MDSKPFTTNLDSPSKTTLLQISNESMAFLIDLKVLANSIELDVLLRQVFIDKRTTCVGFAFEGDLSTLLFSYPKMSFYRKFNKFVDLMSYYKLFINRTRPDIDLKSVAQQILDKELCGA